MTDTFDHTTVERDKQRVFDAVPEITYPQLTAVVDRWLLLADPGALKLLMATIFANELPSDSVWLFLIAPSSGGKSMILNGLMKVPQCYSLSKITPNTFLSGFKTKKGEQEASLLKILGSGKTLLFKDFTSMLDGNKDDVKEIIGQLREIYDQHYTKRTGTGEEISWSGKLGFIAACTPIIEQRMSIIGAMGERFLSYYMKQPKRVDLRAKMRSNIGKDKLMKEELQDAFAGYLKSLKVPEELPVLPPQADNLIYALNDFIAISRAVVMRSMDSKRDIEYIVEPEMSGRTYKQLYTLSLALYIMNGNQWLEEDSQILRKIAMSSIHSLRLALIRAMLTYRTQVKTSTLATELGYPTSTVRRYLEDLAAISMDEGTIRILNRTHQGEGKPDLWQITPAMRNILFEMGESVLATKEDEGFMLDEQEVAVGVQAEVENKIDQLMADLTPEEMLNLGL